VSLPSLRRRFLTRCDAHDEKDVSFCFVYGGGQRMDYEDGKTFNTPPFPFDCSTRSLIRNAIMFFSLLLLMGKQMCLAL
jgi:hypothetical protein